MSSRGTAAALVVAAVAALAGCGDGSDAPASLEGTSWVLTEGVPVVQDVAVTSPTAAFTVSQLSGSTGCNRYGAGYTVDGDSIEIGALALTQVACPAAAATVETAFVTAMGAAETWRFDGDDLVLSGIDGTDLLRFNPAPTS